MSDTTKVASAAMASVLVVASAVALRLRASRPRTPPLPSPAEEARAEQDLSSRASATSDVGDLFHMMRAEVQRVYQELEPIRQRLACGQAASPNTFEVGCPLVLVLGNHSSGKSSFINHVIGRDVQKTGRAPTDSTFTVIVTGERNENLDGNALVRHSEYGFSELDRLFGRSFVSQIEMKRVRGSNVLQRTGLAIVDSPGMIDPPGMGGVTENGSWRQGQRSDLDRGYDFKGVVRWFADRADCILMFFDPDKPASTYESLDVLANCLAHVSHKACAPVHLVLNKVDDFRTVHDFARAYGALCWNLSRMIPRKDLPTIHAMFVPTASAAASRRAAPAPSAPAPSAPALEDSLEPARAREEPASSAHRRAARREPAARRNKRPATPEQHADYAAAATVVPPPCDTTSPAVYPHVPTSVSLHGEHSPVPPSSAAASRGSGRQRDAARGRAHEAAAAGVAASRVSGADEAVGTPATDDEGAARNMLPLLLQAEFGNTRKEVIEEVERAPERAVDNCINRLRDTADRTLMQSLVQQRCRDAYVRSKHAWTVAAGAAALLGVASTLLVHTRLAARAAATAAASRSRMVERVLHSSGASALPVNAALRGAASATAAPSAATAAAATVAGSAARSSDSSVAYITALVGALAVVGAAGAALVGHWQLRRMRQSMITDPDAQFRAAYERELRDANRDVQGTWQSVRKELQRVLEQTEDLTLLPVMTPREASVVEHARRVHVPRLDRIARRETERLSRHSRAHGAM